MKKIGPVKGQMNYGLNGELYWYGGCDIVHILRRAHLCQPMTCMCVKSHKVWIASGVLFGTSDIAQSAETGNLKD